MIRIFTPRPVPPPAPSIYPVDGLLSCETWKAVDIVTAGRLPPAPLLFDPAGATSDSPWEDWLQSRSGSELARGLIEARKAATEGIMELAQRDRQLAQVLPPARTRASTDFGLALLEASQGARHMPGAAKFHRLVHDGSTPGHALAVMALRSAVFGISTVSSLVAWLLCEWAGAESRPAGAPLDRELLRKRFASGSPTLPSLIASWLQAGGNPTFQSASEE